MYNWCPTSCAPEDFPVDIIDGGCYLNEEKLYRIPKRFNIRNGWGDIGAIELIGERKKQLPDSVQITWFSYIERKFYQIKTKLPIKDIQEEFDKGFIRPHSEEKATYQYLIFGTAPRGFLKMWLMGCGITKEVYFSQGSEISYDLNEFIGTIKSLEEYVRIGLKNKYLSIDDTSKKITDTVLTKWSTIYHKRYDLTIRVISSFKQVNIFVNFFNGETKYWNNIKNIREGIGFSIPQKAVINSSSDQGEYNSHELRFDETEILSAIDRLGSKQALTLQFEINNANNMINIFLMNNIEYIKLINFGQ